MRSCVASAPRSPVLMQWLHQLPQQVAGQHDTAHQAVATACTKQPITTVGTRLKPAKSADTSLQPTDSESQQKRSCAFTHMQSKGMNLATQPECYAYFWLTCRATGCDRVCNLAGLWCHPLVKMTSCGCPVVALPTIAYH